VTDAPHEEGDRPPQEMRLRSSRAPVTRLSRKVLLGLGTAAALGIGGALFLALRPQHPTGGSELYNINNRNTPDGLAALPKDYTGLSKSSPQLGPPLPGDLGKPILRQASCKLFVSAREPRPTSNDYVLIFELAPRDEATPGEEMLFGQSYIERFLPKGHYSEAGVAAQIRIAHCDIDSVFAQRQDLRCIFSFEATDLHVRQSVPIQLKKFLKRSRKNARRYSNMQISDFCSPRPGCILDSPTKLKHELLRASVKLPPGRS
jgi:hypothetical protein